MQTTLLPVAASAGGSWTNPSNVVAVDSSYASNASGTGWLEVELDVPGTLLGVHDSIDGLMVTLNAGVKALAGDPDVTILELPPIYARLEIQFSVNGGSSWVGDVGQSEDMLISQHIQAREIGSDTALWSRAWIADEINGGLWVRVRRPSSNETTSAERLLESLQVDVWSTAGITTMANRIVGLQRCVIGRESSPGAGGTPNLLLNGSRFQLSPVDDTEEIRMQGSLIPLDYVTNNSHSTAPWNSNEKACFNDIGLPLASVISKPVTTTLASGVYRHEFDLPVMAIADPQTYIAQYGDTNGCEEVLHFIVQSFNHEFGQRKTSKWGAQAFAQAIDDDATLVAGVNDIQTLTITGTPTGGTFKLRFKGAVTATINHNANAAAIDSALEALATIGTGNVAVTGSGPFTVTFGGDLAGELMPLLELDTNSLTGGSSPDVTIAHTTPGGINTLDYQPIMSNHVVYQADTYAGLGAGEFTELWTGKLGIENRYGMETFQTDSSPATFSTYAEDDALGVNFDFMIAQGTVSKALSAAQDARTNKFVKVYVEGPVIASAIPYSLTMEMACKVRGRGGFPASPGGKIVSREFTAGIRLDESWGHALRVILVNTTSAYS